MTDRHISPLKPDFIVIGAQKSASTFVQTCLQDHPEIYLPKGETPHFETPDYAQAAPGALQAMFAGRTERRQGIKRPNYLGKPEVPARIAADLPDCQLIAVLRNPVDRIVAAYFHQVTYGTLPALPLETGLLRALDDEAFRRAHPRCRELFEFGLYAQNLTRYETFRDASKMLILLHDDIVRDAPGQIRRCYEFLGVDPEFIAPALGTRPHKVTYSIPRLRFLRLRNRFMHTHDAQHTRLTRRQMNPVEYALAGAITLIDRLVLSRVFTSEKPRLSKALRRRLIAAYRPDIEALETMLGRDLGAWLDRG